VAADEIGAGYSTQRLRGAFYRLVECAGLRRITFYHARHSALSYLLNSRQVPIAVVAAWAGHADGGATALKHYIRVRPGDLEAARGRDRRAPRRVSVLGQMRESVRDPQPMTVVRGPS
jgi:integrase